MRGLLAVSFAMLIWGSHAFASRPSEGTDGRAEQLQKIQSWTAHLNHFYPALDLSVSCALERAPSINGVLVELKALEDSLHGDLKLGTDSLIRLSCTRPECGGGEGGKCKSCFAPEADPAKDTL